jgi:hypothetical protein
MSDIVERLTNHANGAYDMTPICSDLLDAKVEIERLRAEVAWHAVDKDRWQYAKAAHLRAIERLKAEVERLREALLKITDALNQGRIVARGGTCGMTIEAQMRASVYNGVPVWPIEEAREMLDEINARAALTPAQEKTDV